MPSPQLRLCLSQLAGGACCRGTVCRCFQAPPVERIVEQMGLGPMESMGRRYRNDPCFLMPCLPLPQRRRCG